MTHSQRAMAAIAELPAASSTVSVAGVNFSMQVALTGTP
jgi:hypothetical protein